MKTLKTLFLIFTLSIFAGVNAFCQIASNKIGSSEEALKIYLEALEIHQNAQLQNNRDLDLKAAGLFKKAIEIDSTHVPSYVQLSWIYSNRMSGNFWEENYLDSSFFFAKKAQSIDKEDGPVYQLLGFLYQKKGVFDKALENYYTAIKFGGDETRLYLNLGSLYFQMGEYKSAVEASMKHYKMQEPNVQTLNHLFDIFRSTGCIAECNRVNDMMLSQQHDSTAWFNRSLYLSLTSGDYSKALQMANELHQKNPENTSYLNYLGYAHFFSRNFTESQKYFEELDKMVTQRGGSYPNFALGYLQLKNGDIEKANIHFDQLIESVTRLQKANLYPESNLPELQLAIFHAARGDNDKAMEHLRNNKSCNLLTVAHLKNNPCFDSIRNEPEFRSVLQKTESRYEAAHRQVGEILEQIAEFK
jgi:tetratricopeptide (TPR) repeat protein